MHACTHTYTHLHNTYTEKRQENSVEMVPEAVHGNVQVEVADCMQTLFRGNSLASKIMAYCFRFYGQWYLCDLLSPLIQEMFHLEKESQVSYEIDHTR